MQPVWRTRSRWQSVGLVDRLIGSCLPAPPARPESRASVTTDMIYRYPHVQQHRGRVFAPKPWTAFGWRFRASVRTASTSFSVGLTRDRAPFLQSTAFTMVVGSTGVSAIFWGVFFFFFFSRTPYITPVRGSSSPRLRSFGGIFLGGYCL